MDYNNIPTNKEQGLITTLLIVLSVFVVIAILGILAFSAEKKPIWSNSQRQSEINSNK